MPQHRPRAHTASAYRERIPRVHTASAYRERRPGQCASLPGHERITRAMPPNVAHYLENADSDLAAEQIADSSTIPAIEPRQRSDAASSVVGPASIESKSTCHY